MLPIVLYGCEAWSLILREKDRLRIFENRVLRRIFGIKREDMVESFRRMHNAELHSLYASPNITGAIKSRRVRWVGNVACMGKMRNV
jgi:hypothetical protein